MKTESVGLFLVGTLQVVFGQDCSSLIGNSGKRFVFDSFYQTFNKLPSQIKSALPANKELSPRCRFDLLNLGDSQRKTLKSLYDQGYAICIGCGYTDSDHGRCHSIDVCKKGSKCIQARNEERYPTYYWHSCCEDGDSKCHTATENIKVNTLGRDSTIRYRKTVCQGPLCNENGYTSQKNDIINFLTQNSAVGTSAPIAVQTTQASQIDGGWTEWSFWGSCDKSCDIGLRFRTRACTSPVPQNGGAYCTGKDKDSELCNVNPC